MSRNSSVQQQTPEKRLKFSERLTIFIGPFMPNVSRWKTFRMYPDRKPFAFFAKIHKFCKHVYYFATIFR